jgi:hypothetical protein
MVIVKFTGCPLHVFPFGAKYTGTRVNTELIFRVPVLKAMNGGRLPMLFEGSGGADMLMFEALHSVFMPGTEF